MQQAYGSEDDKKFGIPGEVKMNCSIKMYQLF